MTDSEIEAAVRDVVTAHREREAPLMPMLHAIQEEIGYIPDRAVPILADAMQTTAAEIYGTISFYHDFKRAPQGRHVLRLCRAEACQSMGSAALHDEIQQRLGISWGETTPDGKVTLEAVYCLGLCACSPSAMMDQRPMGRVDVDRVLAAVAEAR